MTHKLLPDTAWYSVVLAPPRRHRLGVCLSGTTALSPPLSMLALMLVSLAQGVFWQAGFPEAVLAPRRRWSFPSGAAADPAPRGEATPLARSPAGAGRATADSRPAGALPAAAATQPVQLEPPAIAVVPAKSTGTGPARATATPHAQRSQAGDRSAAARSKAGDPLPEAAATPPAQRQPPGIAAARMPPGASRTAPLTATPHAQRSMAGVVANSANLASTPPPNLGPLRGPNPQGEGEDVGAAGTPARQDPMPSFSRGRLKNGAPGGDYLAAPRCGARTRAGGSCQQPAMPNGRCRLHGGKSTGARTAAGRERLRLIHTTHGGSGRDSLAWFRRVDAFIAETQRFMADIRRTGAAAAAVPPAAGGPSGQTSPAPGCRGQHEAVTRVPSATPHAQRHHAARQHPMPSGTVSLSGEMRRS